MSEPPMSAVYDEPTPQPAERAKSAAGYLSDPQRRHLEVVFGMLEQLLIMIEGLAHADARPSPTVLTVDVHNIPPETFAALAPYLEAVRGELRNVTARLALVPRHRSMRHVVHAHLVAEMVRLEERTDRMLRGFGALHPAIPELLDPSLGAMRDALAAMLRLVDVAPGAASAREAPGP